MKETMKILVVDDDQRMVKTICDILRVKGYEAMTAYTGDEAVRLVRTGDPDCVLMDIKMPGNDGVMTMRLIKDLAPDLPVILMSAYATDAQAAEARTLGAYSVLTKPVDIQMVLSFLSILRKEESVLIVDDDPVFCRTLKDLFQTRGFVVDTEVNPGKVLRHMEQDYKLVVLLDLKLGDTNGLDVLKSIRARYPTKPVVLITGYGREMAGSISKGLDIGAYTCLYKPLQADRLIETIREIRRKKLSAVLGEPFVNASRAAVTVAEPPDDALP